MVYIHWLMLALFIGWIIYFGYVLWRFNAARHPKADYAGSKSHLPKYTEFAVVAVEAVLLIGMAMPHLGEERAAIPETRGQHRRANHGAAVRLECPLSRLDGKFGRQDMKLIASDNVFGVDPADPAGKDDVQVLNEIHVVVNKPVLIYLSSKDVIHSLKLVAMRITQDAIPGLRIP